MIDELDKMAKIRRLSDQELNLKHYLNERLVHILREEEIEWYERAKCKYLLEGNDNTQYFHLWLLMKDIENNVSSIWNKKME